jgi:hypothetical protein
VNPFSTGERFTHKEAHVMTNSYRILKNAGDNRIEFGGQSYAEDKLCEAIWLVNIELRNGLPKREQIEAKRQIAQFKNLLKSLQEASVGA